MAGALADAMEKQGVKTLGFIGYSDAYGEGWLNVMTEAAKAKGIKMVAVERYGRTDTSVTVQALKLVAAKPEGILVAGYGTRSEERRVGKACVSTCRYGGSPGHKK